MLKLGILGIGQGGTNIAEYAYVKGFKAVVVNTAQIDLDQAQYIPNDCKIHLGGIGAGRDREVGTSAMISNADKIYEKCQKEFSECDAVFVAATGGGGTGSGGLPIGLEILMNFHKYVGALICLPDGMESPRAKMNTLECFSQISAFESLGSVFIADNQLAKELNPNWSRRKVYAATNKELIDMIVELNQLTDKPSYVSNFDASDLLGIIKERGYTLISKTEFYSDGRETKFDIAKKIRESWSQVYQPMFDKSGQIMRGAIIGKIDEKMSSKVDVDLIFQETGMPYDFNDVYFKPEERDDIVQQKRMPGTFYTILSGLAFPEDRLGKINDQLKSIENKLMNNFNAAQSQTFNTENWSSKFMKKSPVPVLADLNDKHEKINLMDKLTKYRNR
jgi:cell division GTPase FtsZ